MILNSLKLVETARNQMINADVNHLAILDKLIVEDPMTPRLYRPPKQTQTLWPTEASVQYSIDGIKITEGACARAVYYRLIGTKPDSDKDPRMHWIYLVGKNWEDDCNELSALAGILSGKSLRFRNEKTKLPISGEMDSVCSFRDQNGKEIKYVIDYKTTGGSYESISSLLGNSKKNPFPKVSNLLQLMIYLDYDPENLKLGKLVYLIRDSLQRTEFSIQLDDSEARNAIVKGAIYEREDILTAKPKVYLQYSMKEIYRRFDYIAEHYFANQLPEREFQLIYTKERAEELWSLGKIAKGSYEKVISGKAHEAGDFQCRYCPFKNTCWKENSNVK